MGEAACPIPTGVLPGNTLRQLLSSSLLFAAQHFLKAYVEADNDATMSVAFNGYCQARVEDCRNKQLSEGTIGQNIGTLKKFVETIGLEKSVAAVTKQEVISYLEGLKDGHPSPKYWNNIRGLAHHFFEWCGEKRYISQNPVKGIATRKIAKGKSSADIMSVSQVVEMMAFAEEYPESEELKGMMVPYLSLGVFAGVRPSQKHGELWKIDLSSHLNFDTGTIRITPEVSKTNEARRICVQPNLALWLRRYPYEEYPVVVSGNPFIEALGAIRKKFKVPYDGLRRTYISMLVGSFRSVADAALQAGNSETVIRRSYLDLVSMEDADRFWRIVPEGMSLPPLTKIREQGRFVTPEDEQKFDVI